MTVAFDVALIGKDEGLDIPAYDFSTLDTVNQCARKGILRYRLHKKGKESQALKAGSAAHEVYGALRIFELLVHGPDFYGDDWLLDEVVERSIELYGDEWTDQIILEANSGEDYETRKSRVVWDSWERVGYEESQTDTRRTHANILDALTFYAQKVDHSKQLPVVKKGFVGVEQSFNCVVRWGGQDESVRRFTGKTDGIHWWDKKRERVLVSENKTTSRINDVWRNTFALSHQLTGYCVAAGLMAGSQCSDGEVIGMAIPIPKSNAHINGVTQEPFFRESWQIDEWANWHLWTSSVMERFNAMAPMSTNACSNYNTICEFIGFCSASPEEKADILNDYEEERWDPLNTN